MPTPNYGWMTPVLPGPNNVPADLLSVATQIDESLYAEGRRSRQIVFPQIVNATTDANGYFTFAPSYPVGTTAETAPRGVVFQDALTNFSVGPLFVRWDSASSSATSIRAKVFQSSGTALPSYPVRLAVLIATQVSG